MRMIDADALKAKFCNHCDERDCKPDATGTVYGCVIADTIDSMPTIEAITREQYHDMTERFFDEFEENGADEETLAKCIFIGLAFGKLELMLFGSKDGDNECG